MKPRAMTVMEMMTVLVVVGLVGLLAVPAASAMLRSAQIQQEISLVALFVREARYQAGLGTPVLIKPAPDGGVIRQPGTPVPCDAGAPAGPSCGCNPNGPEEALALDRIMATADSLCFLPNGRSAASNGERTLTMMEGGQVIAAAKLFPTGALAFSGKLDAKLDVAEVKPLQEVSVEGAP